MDADLLRAAAREHDIILAGSGIAAHALIHRIPPDRRILLLEGGETRETTDGYLLTLGDEYGHYAGGHWSDHWVRAYGGTSRRWAGALATLDDRDFDGAGGLPSWPIGAGELGGYYREAARFLGRHESIAVTYPQAPAADDFLYKPFSMGEPRRFIEPVELSNVTVATGTHVVRPLSATRRSVDGLVLHADGMEFALPVNGNQDVILACGGLGNAQVLLQPAADGGTPVGNESGMAGRFLMEHPHARSASLYIAGELATGIDPDFGGFAPAYMASDRLYREHGLLACLLMIGALDASRDEPDPVREHFEERFARPLVRADALARSEQEPGPLNRVTIVAEKNRAGLHRLRTQCALSTRDLWSIDQTTRLFGQYLQERRLGVARIDNDGIYRHAQGGGHTMGTTRMGRSPADSVCDADARVHGYGNLYLAGSSLFTTAGAANPTLTLTALALRLADHLTDKRR